jgi:hypothetical protein
MERFHSDGAIPPGRKYFLLMEDDDNMEDMSSYEKSGV